MSEPLVVEASEIGWSPGQVEQQFEYQGRRWMHVDAIMHGFVVCGWRYRAMFGSPSDGEGGRPYLHVLND